MFQKIQVSMINNLVSNQNYKDITFVLKKLRLCIIRKKNKHLPQNELNSLYESDMQDTKVEIKDWLRELGY